MRPVLIDTDPGVDDALALLLAWGSPELDVQALTTVAGNVAVELATLNACRLVALRQPRPRPVIAVGAARPLARAPVTATHYHGEDGLGDAGPWPVPTLSPTSADATELMVRIARHYGPHLSIIALGPLTNLALALAADPEAMGRIGQLVIMGGAVDVPGNATATAEFNIHVVPEAAARVLGADLPIALVPLDATRQVVLPRDRLTAALAAAPRPLGQCVAAFTAGAFRVDSTRGQPGMVLHDPLAVGAAISEHFVEWESMRLSVGPDGATRRSSGTSNCRVAIRVNVEAFLTTLLERLAR
ncbi:MAG: nucleoside hydrolase [Candidatus Rokuibacteriota bacterium]